MFWFLEFLGARVAPALLTLLAFLLIWRFYRFTVVPYLRPHEPPELPYWIPGIGHAISYIRDSFALLTYGRHYFNDRRNPFSINLAGEQIYILTDPADVTMAYRNNSSLTMDVFLQDLMKGFGISEEGRALVYRKPSEDANPSKGNPKNKPLAHLLVDWFRLQLHPGPQLMQLGQVTLEYVEVATRWENMIDPRIVLAGADSSSTEKHISLLKWCENILLRSAVRSFFGDILTDINPQLLDDFLDFDDVSWKLLYRYHPYLSKDMHSAKDKIVGTLEKYFAIPREDRPDANWLVMTMETEMRNLKVSKTDMAKMIGLIYWVINTNAYKLLFWMISFMLRDPDLTKKVTEELQSAFRPDGTLDLAALQQAATPYSTALFNETMRLANSSASAREITRDTQIGQYTLKAGRKLLIPYRQLHLNKAVFGEDPTRFDASRFVNDPKLAKHPSYRPFGGGATYCPGSYFAKQEIFMCLAHLLCRYDVSLAPRRKENEQPPRMDELKPGIGIIPPVAGDEVMMRVAIKKNTVNENFPL